MKKRLFHRCRLLLQRYKQWVDKNRKRQHQRRHLMQTINFIGLCLGVITCTLPETPLQKVFGFVIFVCIAANSIDLAVKMDKADAKQAASDNPKSSES